ncbi:aromatic ring-hydroxylating dioxygenase subunit alpha [Pseudomonas sp. P1B16]|jgi:vanillate O-demethylase monooxygenase subunit|uniref:aromatic ring-hydroxylating dioxygenase subunit alpha n=1 Tax=Pseudomonas TaxID=286 RepID=UPI0004D46515|nr:MULTISPECIES: aromatic ring-hydroxylating dioxygenase subunit alpha [Pseudomonas]KEY88999.1 Rieske (2Fe-2S) protein [Pseudomonas capeferrum]KGI92100.1 Rieske (2Fe-2S) protein [Pseudomonas sp. H2]MCH7301083.1 aromatic ring-hydroxylating dioxygenase subunit alpha [Pseudomonas capeferrum]MDD2066063.1 aromatic ring-hydroxylating dioxygenase subunit alpha [Pseudomonas sp. 25571]MDD2130551.1 aromatic ring-hydroxylating dioxygenase subunit alpha [Pseudomonas sp. 17391]
MSLPTSNLIAHARKASEPMANRETPFIYNEWYVAAFDDEVGRHLLARRLLDRRVVMYRTEAGEPIALEDRCAHRSFPLSRSHLQGDTIVCGYHGFRYDAAGDLTEVPSQKNCPRGIGVRRYPLVRQGPLLWIWLGEEALADAAQIPHQAWIDDPAWACTSGYFHHPGNYVSLHENLMDLTHLSFLHANTIGTPDYASAPYKLDLKEGHYTLIREVVPTTLSPVWGKTTGLEGCPSAARIATSEFLSPGLHRVSVTFYDSAQPLEQRQQFHIRTAHILTPETANSLHYFIVHGRDFAQHDEALGEYMHEQLFAAFNEDVEGLGALEAALDDRDDHHYEISVASDAPAVATRLYLKKRADAERQHDSRKVG